MTRIHIASIHYDATTHPRIVQPRLRTHTLTRHATRSTARTRTNAIPSSPCPECGSLVLNADPLFNPTLVPFLCRFRSCMRRHSPTHRPTSIHHAHACLSLFGFPVPVMRIPRHASSCLPNASPAPSPSPVPFVYIFRLPASSSSCLDFPGTITITRAFPLCSWHTNNAATACVRSLVRSFVSSFLPHRHHWPGTDHPKSRMYIVPWAPRRLHRRTAHCISILSFPVRPLSIPSFGSVCIVSPCYMYPPLFALVFVLVQYSYIHLHPHPTPPTSKLHPHPPTSAHIIISHLSASHPLDIAIGYLPPRPLIYLSRHVSGHPLHDVSDIPATTSTSPPLVACIHTYRFLHILHILFVACMHIAHPFFHISLRRTTSSYIHIVLILHPSA
ncbi:hypothetical protein C8R43DRAFT_495883 [Mycena crocata]|nr:hypothetical protein C8R43DRAFT_495883 [Mycena crocata]